jgi:glycosyltransferase involved in cell wall biosynthesis
MEGTHSHRTFCELEGPLVSIITVVLNGEEHLAGAIESVVNQSYRNIEYIVVDGGSTDTTPAIISGFKDHIAILVREADEGIYHAMNKGLGLSRGKYIGFLNADDRLYPDAVERVVAALTEGDLPGYTGGTVHLMAATGEIFGEMQPLPEPRRLSRKFLEMPFSHLSMFVDRVIFQELGGFDTRYRLRADYDLYLRMLRAGYLCQVLPEPLGAYRVGGASAGVATFFETMRVHRAHGVGLCYRHWVFLRSLIRFWSYRALPFRIINYIKRRTISKNVYYDK